MKFYCLSGFGFKADFNWKFVRLQKLLDVRTPTGYLKMDIVLKKCNDKVYLCRRLADFTKNKAMMETWEIDSIHNWKQNND